MEYKTLYEQCKKHNINLIEQGGWMKFYYQGKLCGVVSTRYQRRKKIMNASARDGLVAKLMNQLANTTIKKRGPR